MRNKIQFLVVIVFFIAVSINGQVFYTDPPLEDSNKSYIDQFNTDKIDCSLTQKEFIEVVMDWSKSDPNIKSEPACIDGSDIAVLDATAPIDDLDCVVKYFMKLVGESIDCSVSIEFRKGWYTLGFRDFKKNGARDNYYIFLTQKEFQDVVLADMSGDNGMSNGAKEGIKRGLADPLDTKLMRKGFNRVTLARRNKITEVLNKLVKEFSEKVLLKER